MFSLNNSFYVPMYWIPQQFNYYSPILNVFPNSNCFQAYPLTVNQKQNDLLTTQNERDDYNSMKLVNIQPQEKNIGQIKRNIQNKNIQKQMASNNTFQDQSEKLKRKLANRPKTYQTEKKMYLNHKLQEQQDENSKRKLRQRKPLKHMKSKRQRQEKQNNQIKKQEEKKSLCQKLKKYYKQKSKTRHKYEQNLEFSLNMAVVPLNKNEFNMSQQIKMEKKIDLLSRKFQTD